jgi:hypothetical protein
MAVEKEAPAPDICAAAVASREALEAAVVEFTETLAAVPLSTIKKRLRNADIVTPFGNSASNGSLFAKVEGLEPEVEIKDLDSKL